MGLKSQSEAFVAFVLSQTAFTNVLNQELYPYGATEGKEFPDGSMILGSPAKAVKTLTPEQIAGIEDIAGRYVKNAQRYRQTLKKIA